MVWFTKSYRTKWGRELALAIKCENVEIGERKKN